VTAASSSSLAISWVAPASVVTSYTVEVSTDGFASNVVAVGDAQADGGGGAWSAIDA
jgi:hypothetical protein